MPEARKVLKTPFDPLEDLGDWINIHAVPDTDPNQTVLMGSGGRAATREELEAYLTMHKQRMEREAREAGLELDLG